MSSRFEKVIQQASTLPIEIQDEITGQWLEDIENEIILGLLLGRVVSVVV